MGEVWQGRKGRDKERHGKATAGQGKEKKIMGTKGGTRHYVKRMRGGRWHGKEEAIQDKRGRTAKKNK